MGSYQGRPRDPPVLPDVVEEPVIESVVIKTQSVRQQAEAERAVLPKVQPPPTPAVEPAPEAPPAPDEAPSAPEAPTLDDTMAAAPTTCWEKIDPAIWQKKWNDWPEDAKRLYVLQGKTFLKPFVF
jgi:hypothetical protein